MERAGEMLSELLAMNLAASFEQLVRQFRHRLYAFALRQTKNAEEAEDIVQEAFLQAYITLETYPQQRIRELKLSAWLHKITLYIFYNRRRKGRLQEEPLDFSEESEILDAATGQTRWITPSALTSSTSNVSTPAVLNSRVYICLQDRRLYAFDAFQGRQQWVSPAGHDMFSSPTVVAGAVYITSGGRIYAFEASSGHLLWVSQAVAGEDSAASPVAVANNLAYVGLSGTGAGMGRVYAFDALNGAFKWSSELVNGGIDINSAPTVTDELVYIGAGNGGLIAFDAQGGKRRWTTPAAAASTGSSPAIAEGIVYFANDRVTAFDAHTGQQRWRTKPIGAYNADSPLVANGVIYVCSAGNNSVYALDARSGQTLWTSPPANSQLFTTPAVADGAIYAASEDGALYAFSLPGST